MLGEWAIAYLYSVIDNIGPHRTAPGQDDSDPDGPKEVFAQRPPVSLLEHFPQFFRHGGPRRQASGEAEGEEGVGKGGISKLREADRQAEDQRTEDIGYEGAIRRGEQVGKSGAYRAAEKSSDKD